jgi:hypothetical protein
VGILATGKGVWQDPKLWRELRESFAEEKQHAVIGYAVSGNPPTVKPFWLGIPV